MRWTLLACALAAQPFAWSQTGPFPNKTLRVIVPLGGGSGLDSSARKFAQVLSEEVHQPVIVENKPGADSAIGIREMLNAPADGYTLVALTGGMLYMTPFLIKDLAYKPEEIHTLVALGASDAVLLVGANSKWTSLSQVIAEAKKSKNTFFGSYSQTFRGARVMLEKAAGVQFVEVPYKGAGQMITDLAGGAFDVAFMDLPSAEPLIKGGKVRALAVASPKRSSLLPDVPTFAESGYPAVNLVVWSGIGISNKTPKAVVDQLSARVTAAAQRPEMQQFYVDRSSRPLNLEGAKLADFIQKETELYKGLLK